MGIFQDKKGYWRWQKIHRGIIYTGSTGSDRRKAKKQYDACCRQIALAEATGAAMPDPIRFHVLCGLYLQYSKTDKAPSTYEREKISISRHILPFIKRRHISKITPVMIERFKAQRLRDGAKNSTVNTELKVLKAIFNKAIEWGYIDRSPARSVKKLRETKKEVSILTDAQVADFLAACRESRNPSLYAFVVTGFNTGMRKSELFGLTWADVDLELGAVKVYEPKTDKHRTAYLNDFAASVLREHPHRGKYVFYTHTGNQYRDIRGAFNAALRKAGLPRLTFHDMRHHYITSLLAVYPPAVVQKIVGQRDLRSTMAYDHTDGLAADAAKMVTVGGE